MKIKNIALDLLIYFLYFLGSCILVMLAEALLVSIIEKFVAIPYPVLTVIRIVIYTAGVPALLGCLGYFEGYREAACSVPETVISGLLDSVLHPPSKGHAQDMFGYISFRLPSSRQYRSCLYRCQEH